MLALRPWTAGILAAGGATAASFAIGFAVFRLIAPAALVTPGPAVAPRPTLPSWSPVAVKQLLGVVEASGDEGLRPSDYQPDMLARIVRAGAHGPQVDALAETAARTLGHDYAVGRVTRRKRIDWHINSAPAILATLDTDLDAAVRGDRVDSYLNGLLPQDSRYRALREALRDTRDGDGGRRTHIRASMERWRWMPRLLGADYVFVNVPSYRVALFERDAVVATHDVVVGAPDTPTPMLAATVGSIIINPWWTLPPTVLREGAGKRYSPERGYVYQTIGGKTYVRQKPGPLNALGRVKINMPNPYAIYLHDTPAKWAFAKTDRALSHGCIRVKDIATLAEKIGDATAVTTALGTDVTHTVAVPRTLPVYIVYFTAAPDADGHVQMLPDPYGRDAGVIAALDAPASASSALSRAPARPATIAATLPARAAPKRA